MSWILRFWESTVGKKLVMAVTGAIGLGFVMVHLIGNLLVYVGRDAINAYGVKLREIPPLLWGTRITLVVAVILHIICYLQLGSRMLEARPVPYARPGNIQASFSSRTMRWTGPFLALFIIYHLANLTWGKNIPNYVPGDIYNNMINTFSLWWVSAFYVLAMVGLGFHLIHGSWSMWSSLGINHPRYNPILRLLGVVFTTVVVVVGNISMPAAVYFGLIK